MSAKISYSEPLEFTAGDTVQWKKTLTDYYPADGWTLTYTLINAQNKISIVAGSADQDHYVNVSAATSAGYQPGKYAWQAHVSNGGGERYLVDSGNITIHADFATLTVKDPRAHCEKMIDAIQAHLEKSSTIQQQEYQIGDRRLWAIPISELRTLLNQYKAELQVLINQDRLNSGQKPANKLVTRFNNGRY